MRLRKKRMKIKWRCLPAIIAVLLYLCGGERYEAYAAEEEKAEAHTEDRESSFDPARLCSLTVDIPKAYRDALYSCEIPVRLYRIAEFSAEGACRELPGYEGLCLEELSASPTAQELEDTAQETAAILHVDTWTTDGETDGSGAIAPDVEFDIVHNRGEKREIKPGLYLVCVRPVSSEGYTYQVLPYIVALPNRLEITKNDGSFTELEYDLTMDLKLGRNAALPVPTDPAEEPATEKEQPEDPAIPGEPAAEEEPPANIIRTGDDTKVELSLIIAVCAGLLAAAAAVLRRRGGKKK